MLPRIALHLTRHADPAWREVVRPWLEAGRKGLARSLVVVPTRGQAHLLKQRCLEEGLPLLGVEFLTPGLARKKWLALVDHPVAGIGREFLLLGLRQLIHRKLAPLTPDEPAWGWWRSLQSDPERALDDFDELLKGGFRADDFPLGGLREIFGELTAWVERLGSELVPVQSEAAALRPLADGAPRIDARLLVVGLTAEAWGEFFNVAALVRRVQAVTVVLPEPMFRGRGALDEKWIELWQALLGVEAELVDESSPVASCAAVGELWTHEGGGAGQARVLVGQTRADEMQHVAAEIVRLLAAGAENIGVIFPRADAAHLRLARLLADRGVPFADLMETAGPPPADVQVQHALLEFYERGARLDELLQLWPWLRAMGATTQPLGAARDVCERLFDEGQSHALAGHLPRLLAGDRPAWREVARIAQVLLPPWPEACTWNEALDRFEAVCTGLDLEPVAGWPALRAFAARTDEVFPAEVALAALKSFLPAQSAVPDAPGRGRFARVTLATRRRAEGMAWSHLLLVESNAGIWPERREPSCWLTDDHRERLNQRGRFSLGLFTAEDRAGLERQAYAALVRDTRTEVVFTAALFDEEEPELKLAPNAWLERVLWAQGRAAAGGLEQAFTHLAAAVPPSVAPSPLSWTAVWQSRRDPAHPFDEYFLAGDPARLRPDRLAARRIERGVQDPAELWFGAVLEIERVPWEPLVRQRARTMGQLTHRLLAGALRPRETTWQDFGPWPAQPDAEAALATALTRLRQRWPDDRYWDSCHGELAGLCRALLQRVYEVEAGPLAATESGLPARATLDLDGVSCAVSGRMDLVRLDRPAWAGATVDIFDFKTGGDAALSAARMARDGDSLQLALYLAAARSLGATAGRVWMIKPQAGGASALDMAELPAALPRLQRLRGFLETGIYGALTPERSPYGATGFVWPLACVPVPAAILRGKFAVTFGDEAGGEAVGDE